MAVTVVTLVVGGILIRSDDQMEGVQASNQLVDTDRERVQQFWVVYRQGTQARIAGNVDAAAEAYRQALSLDPDHADALYYLGNMELQRGRLGDAETAWRHLLVLDSASARAHVQLGRVLSCADRDTLNLTGARQAFERAILINQEETGPLLLLAEAFDSQPHRLSGGKVLRRFLSQADAGRRAGRDNVACVQRHELTEVAD